MTGDKFGDRGYRALFSFPRMVEDLLRSFVKLDFVDHIDFSTLRRINSSFVTEDFRSRETDVLWEVKSHGQSAYIYFLIEFQTTVDRFMAVRLLHYILLFYEDLRKQKRLRRLPPVFPIVLYSGDRRWVAPLELQDLIEPSFHSLKPYVPSFAYYKIAENEFPKEHLKSLNNLAAKLFLLETGDVSELPATIEAILDILKETLEPQLQREFGLWVRARLRRSASKVDIDSLNETEVGPVLEAKLNEFEKAAVERGRVSGQIDALRETLVSGWQARFNAEPTVLRNIIDRITEASVLQQLTKILFTATDQDAFLGAVRKAQP